ncbi:protein FAM13A-like [Macrosteles quadrilineatus]|uniref:protein FAM13A-like n=1 Tax=Macrosteles quadrilineatus TaxID=74068 RepID=UPI0023E25D7A|nr:protein FAM13A-like [Macrosteles quadrilineatus]XP_054264652.1 protein FAM13A-like [Macrosteles quadrilineatus]XP_054264653.1 protein FAM13A-like [Macrosteles quadrilineatus]
MRRPTFCNNSVAVQPPRSSDKEEGRLTKVKRMFTSSLRKPVVNRVFAVPLEELPTNKDHVPKVLIKMSNYIESYGLLVEGLFRLSGGNPALVEQLKASFNRVGDVDLETCADVASVASLLKLWLRDLPEPLVSPATTAELVTLVHKYGGSTEWCGQARITLQELPPRHAATLRHTLQLLHLYSLRQPTSAANLPAVFSPLLLCAEFHGISTPETTHVTACLIRDYNHIYCDKVGESVPNELKQRKRKERHNSDAASLDRKFVRSNSEERPSVEEKQSCQSDSIRRVSSHEDFTTSRKHTQSHNVCQPLHEHNWPTVTSNRHCHKQRAVPANNNNNNNSDNNNENGLSQLIESSPSPGYASDLFDENEHERRRQSERHAPCVPPARVTRRRRSTGKLVRQWSSSDDPDSSSKENEEEGAMVVQPTMPLSEDESRSTSSSSERSFLQLHDEVKDRCPSPEATPTTPPLDLSTLHQQVDSTEPLTSLSFRHHQVEDRLVSPRSSIVMTRRVFSDDTPQHASDSHLSQVSKQIHSLKRKLKRYEEGFEKEFGYRPSHADKLANPDTKKMCSLLTKLRKEVKTLKEEGTSVLEKALQPGSSSSANSNYANKEEAIHDVEKRLMEKRMTGNRPETVDDMTREQLVEEKLAVQRGLLYLENTFGRPSTREDRDLVRPLYDRYRSLKRLLARNAPSKLKETVTELGTILEHETMDFTSSSPPPPPSTPPVMVPSSPPRCSTPDLENLHALPLQELLKQQQQTREEKKRLRRSLREFEEECQKTVGRKLSREDRLPMEQTYAEYKHAKAKLRLLEALVMKQK